jgi:beta-lactamase superfamily II metal-dependent hydrolase
MHEAATHGIQIVRLQRGYRWTYDGVTLDILAPSLPVLADTGDDINENSIVAMLHYGSFRELFMGDAGESSEARLLASVRRLGASIFPFCSWVGF